MLTLLVVTRDRPAQLACCLTSLLFQLPEQTTVEVWDNGEGSVLDDPMVRGIATATAEVYGWKWRYRRVKPASIGSLNKAATDGLEGDGMLLWTDDDVLWGPGAFAALLEALDHFHIAAPVVVDIFDRGFPDFTGTSRLPAERGATEAAPANHLYERGSAPFEVPYVTANFLAREVGLVRGHCRDVSILSDVVSSLCFPGSKAVVPAAECWHMAHTRPASTWIVQSLQKLWRDGEVRIG